MKNSFWRQFIDHQIGIFLFTSSPDNHKLQLENSVAPDDFLFHSTTKPILPSLQPSISSWNSTSISATEIIPSINSVSLNVGPIFHNTHTTIVYPILINTLTNLTETNTQLPLTLLPATAALIVSSTITSPNYHVTAIHPSLPQITLPAGIATPQFTPITESSMGQHQLPAYRREFLPRIFFETITN